MGPRTKSYEFFDKRVVDPATFRWYPYEYTPSQDDVDMENMNECLVDPVKILFFLLLHVVNSSLTVRLLQFVKVVFSSPASPWQYVNIVYVFFFKVHSFHSFVLFFFFFSLFNLFVHSFSRSQRVEVTAVREFLRTRAEVTNPPRVSHDS